MRSLEYPFQLRLPTQVFLGTDVLEQIPLFCRPYGLNILMVTAKDLSAAENRLKEQFVEKDWRINTYYLGSPEPDCDTIDAAAEGLRNERIDCIIALGGGSVIDAAKALSIALTHEDPVWLFANLSNRPPIPMKKMPVPVVALPTTSGTGSEVTPYAVLTNGKTKQKGTIQDPQVFPKAAFVNPEFTLSMPDSLTAATGFDALAHAFESFINISKPSAVSEWAGKEAIKLIFSALPEVLAEPNNVQLRAVMAWASVLAGVAIAHRGTTVTHAIAEPLGALTHLPHGLSVALSTLPVMRRTWEAETRKFAELLWIVDGTRDKSAPEGVAAEMFASRVENLVSKVGLNKTVSDCLPEDKKQGLKELLLENVLTYKFRPLKQHPVEFSGDVLAGIIREIVDGK